MWTLRLFLIALGLLLIIGLYFYTRRQQSQRRRGEKETTKREPDVRMEPGWSRHPTATPPVSDFKPVEERKAPKEAGGEEKIFTLAVRLPEEGVAAETVTRTLERLGCELGVGHIYHCHGPDGQALYSVANLFEPGVLAPLAPNTSLRGLVFFFTARPGTNATLPFGRMLGAAREAAERLGGRVQDDSHRPLTAARELELKMAAERND